MVLMIAFSGVKIVVWKPHLSPEFFGFLAIFMFAIFHCVHLIYNNLTWLKVELISAGVSVFVVDGSDGGIGLRRVERRKLRVFGDVKTPKFLPIFLT